jgi:hypothetical protein
MNQQEATYVASSIADLSTHYKSMDITSQLTQLNALTKLVLTADCDTPSEHQLQLKECISRRQNKLSLSLDALFVLESQWDQTLEPLMSMLINSVEITE